MASVPPETPIVTPAQDKAKSLVTLLCVTAGGATRVLPDKLSAKAHKELERACVNIKASVDKQLEKIGKNARELEAVSTGDFSGVSQESWKELQDIAADYAKKNASSDPAANYTKGPDPRSVSVGPGKDYSIAVPFGFSNGADVRIFVNADSAKLQHLTLDTKGYGASATYQKGNTSGEARVYVDTTAVQPRYGGYIGVKVDF